MSHQTHYGIGLIGDDFYRSNDPTNSVKALKEETEKTIQEHNIINCMPSCKMLEWFTQVCLEC